jgi:GNAT superfamily N-acetyltransferase
MDPVVLTITDEPARDDVHYLDERRYEYNVEASGWSDGRLLATILRDEDGRIMAGLYGWTWGQCCFVDKVWIHRAWRGHGLGTRLMRAAEAEARARGAEQIVLDTHSFQAPDFYAKLGFERVGAFDDYPRGFQRIFMRKQLETATREDGTTA